MRITPPTAVRTALLLGVPFLVVMTALALGAGPSADPIEDPLAPFLGHRVVVEFPRLDDVGRTRAVPDGWRYFQVTTAAYDALSDHLAPDHPEALLYFDEYGNRVLRDHSRDRIARIGRSVEAAEKHIANLRDRFRGEWEEVLSDRAEGKAAEELAGLLRLRDSGLRGYPELEEARSRLAELEGLRLEMLWAVLAREGLVRPRDLARALSELADRSRGLAIEPRIRREMARIDRDWVTRGGRGER